MVVPVQVVEEHLLSVCTVDVVVVGASATVLVGVVLVADLLHARIDGGVLVVAVLLVPGVPRRHLAGLDGGAVRLAVPVAVGVHVPGAHRGGIHAVIGRIDQAIAVVVHRVADLKADWVDVVATVIAVLRNQHVVIGLLALDQRVVLVSKAVPVRIQVPGGEVHHLVQLVNLPIAVIVSLVAVLVRLWVDINGGVVTVVCVVDPELGLRAGGLELVGVAEPILVEVGVPGERVFSVFVVFGAVAVVVDIVAEFSGISMGGGVSIVTVSLQLRVAIFIVVVLQVVDKRAARVGGGAGARGQQQGRQGEYFMHQNLPPTASPLAWGFRK